MSDENDIRGQNEQSNYSQQEQNAQQNYNQQGYNAQQNYNQQGYNAQQNYNQQGYNAQQNYNQQRYNAQQNYNQQQSSGFGIASMICGIIALITCCLWCTCIPLAVVSIVFGILQIQKGTAKGMAIAGIVCSSIALVLFIILTVWGNYLESTGTYNEILRQLEQMQY